MFAPEVIAARLFLNILQFEIIEFDLKSEIAPLPKVLFRVLYLSTHLSIMILQSSILIEFPYSKITFLKSDPSD